MIDEQELSEKSEQTKDEPITFMGIKVKIDKNCPSNCYYLIKGETRIDEQKLERIMTKLITQTTLSWEDDKILIDFITEYLKASEEMPKKIDVLGEKYQAANDYSDEAINEIVDSCTLAHLKSKDADRKELERRLVNVVGVFELFVSVREKLTAEEKNDLTDEIRNLILEGK